MPYELYLWAAGAVLILLLSFALAIGMLCMLARNNGDAAFGTALAAMIFLVVGFLCALRAAWIADERAGFHNQPAAHTQEAK